MHNSSYKLVGGAISKGIIDHDVVTVVASTDKQPNMRYMMPAKAMTFIATVITMVIAKTLFGIGDSSKSVVMTKTYADAPPHQ